MPDRIKFCCPNCGSTDLRSTERIEAVFDVEIVLGEDGGRIPRYSGDREVFADNSDFENRLDCKSCGTMLGTDELTTPAQQAHRGRKVVEILPDTDLGENLRFRARCTAFGYDYECAWTGNWRTVRAEDPQLSTGPQAYAQAESDGEAHLGHMRAAVTSAGQPA